MSDLRALVDAVEDYAIFLLAADGTVVSWNRGAHRIKGYAPAEIIGQHFSRFYTPEDVAAGKPERALRTAAETGHFRDEGWRLRKDGTRLWASVLITALRDERGRVRGFGKVTRDLTERREAQEELRRSEERFHHLIDTITDYAMYMLDPGGHVATWNPGARKAKGYTRDEIIGQHFSVFYTEEDRQAGKPAAVLAMALRDGRFNEEGWRLRKDGTRFWANVTVTPMLDDHGDLMGFAKITRDLSQRRAEDERLRVSEERFRLLVEGVTDYAIYLLDPTGRVTTWNRGAERMKGYRADEIIGRDFARFFPPEDVDAGKPAQELALALAEGRFEVEGWRLRKDGSRFWARVVVTPLRDDTGELIGFAKVTQDLTQQRDAEVNERRLLREQVAREAAEGMASKAEEANRIKDEFLATVSHELRTPLNAIVGWATILRSRPLEPAVARAIEVIDRNAHAQVKIIDDLLDVSRIISGKLRVETRPTDLMALVQQTIDVVRPSAAGKAIQLRVEGSPGPCTVIGDPERLQQVIWNLLSNAVKFTGDGGSVVASVTRELGRTRLCVVDTGSGIDPSFLPYVFDRFKQADSSATRRHGGLGLGLALVRHLLEMHGGTVSAQSAGPGLGSTFTVLLPSHMPTPDITDGVVGRVPAVTPTRAISLAGIRVLVVDDEADARELVTILLHEAGAEVTAVASAAEALEALPRARPHVLVSDIAMPGEDGHALLRRVRALPRDQGGGIPSIALTGYTRSEDRATALAAGFTTHVGKPIQPAELVTAVANIAGFRAQPAPSVR
ncbi:MAG: PAS domain S-box protein [Polyangiaceae bacterium]